VAKSELYGNPLIPMVLVAGILSGGLWRGTPPAEIGKPGDPGSSGDKSDGASPTAAWVSDLHPVLESLDGAFGARMGSALTLPLEDTTAIKLAAKGDARDQQILDAIFGLRTGLNRLSRQNEPATCEDGAELKSHASVLRNWMLIDDGGDGKTRAAEARALLEEFRDWRLLTYLATGVKKSREGTGHPIYSVDFIVATIPDYVDSNSGWQADQVLAATQSAMAQDNYLFDRVRLVDWSRASAGPLTVLSGSRLHERQPGAIIFRRVADRDIADRSIRLQVVLTVLETPTAGVHQVALRNSLRFLRAWNACSSVGKPSLKVLGPTFSGSTVSLAMVLGEAPFPTSFSGRFVVTGSATADENDAMMKQFSNGAIFKAPIQPTSVLKARMAAYLESVNSTWKDGNGVALLNESNTAFGGDANKVLATPTKKSDSNSTAKTAPPFIAAKVFNFPLHIAQLRSDAPSQSQPGTALLSTPAIPLNLREATPPSDAIPALRPQLTGPVVGTTVDSILDVIRHEKISAVGILATDDRDVLFLAREVKRSSPDVQLFLFGTHALYLHPDYVPYLRGALVASSYALTLANQPEIPGTFNALHRQPFSSMSAEGVFYAARALVSLSDTGETAKLSLEYCSPNVVKNAPPAAQSCVPIAPASINVVGEDGYWTLPDRIATRNASTSGQRADTLTAIPTPSDLNVAPLPPLPVQFMIGAVLVLMIVGVHLWVMFRIKRVFDHHQGVRSGGAKDLPVTSPFFELPLVRVLVPPLTFNRAAGLHRFALTVCFALLSLAAAWVVAIMLPFFLPQWAMWLVLIATLATCGVVIYTGVKSYGPRQMLPCGLTANAQPSPKPRRTAMAVVREAATQLGKLTMTEQMERVLFGGMVVTMALFLAIVVQIAIDAAIGAQSRLTFARIVGGGIISPAALTVFLAASFYTAVFTDVRRLSLAGFGYARLGGGSRAFGLLTAEGEPPVGEPKQGSLAALLDMPAKNMPSIYPAALLLILLVAAISAKSVTTIEGRTFSWFVIVGTWTTLGLGLLQLAQGLALWNTARSHLKRLAQTPIEKHLQGISPQVPWNISLVPPRLTELMAVAHMADSVLRDFRSLVFAGRRGAVVGEVTRNLGNVCGLAGDEEVRLGVRPGDLVSLGPLFAEPSHVRALETEMGLREHAAIIQSETWFGLWKLSDSLVTMLQRTAWLRGATTAPERAVRREAEVVGIPGAVLIATAVAESMPGHVDTAHQERSGAGSPSGWFARCEQLIALQMAFVLRDIVARTITCLLAAMLCLTSLTAAHLLYVFNGRASLLTIDMLAVAATALSAISILVDMERDHVLSRLRSTIPGRVDMNWEFFKRLAVYGVLPLLAVIATLFPEVGGTLFGWLEPLRKLSSF
jgi:hypothetical protein